MIGRKARKFIKIKVVLITLLLLFPLACRLMAETPSIQEQKKSAQTTDWLSPNLQPVPEARVEITIAGKSKSIQTDEYGVFGIEISDPEKFFGTEKFLKVKLLVTTFPPLPKNYTDFLMTVEINREEGPLYALAIVYDRNNDTLLPVKLRADLILISPPAGAMLNKSQPLLNRSGSPKQIAVF
ncbi:MAG: hypothetical protein ACPLRX_04255 [Candidatus Saccharicenans sp.]